MSLVTTQQKNNQLKNENNQLYVLQQKFNQR